MPGLIDLRIWVFFIKTTEVPGEGRNGWGGGVGTNKSQCMFLKEPGGGSVEQGHQWDWDICQVAIPVVQKRDDGWMGVVASEKRKGTIFQIYLRGRHNRTWELKGSPSSMKQVIH